VRRRDLRPDHRDRRLAQRPAAPARPARVEDFTDLTEGGKTRVAAARAGERDPVHPGRLVARQPGIIARFGSGHKAGRTRVEHIELAVSRS
jgi:hypothetical protein